MEEACKFNAEQPELKSWCSRNSSLEAANTHLGWPMVRPWMWSNSNLGRNDAHENLDQD